MPELTQSGSASGWRRIALTKRRAVDFCRVATAICPAGPLSRAR